LQILLKDCFLLPSVSRWLRALATGVTGLMRDKNWEDHQ
jgi:hypothetical protein